MKSDFPQLVSVIEEGISIGLHIGATVHVRKAGQILADFSIGAASLKPWQALNPAQMMLWLSAGKPLTALAIGILVDRGRVSFDAPVAEYIPDFARNDKEEITLRNLLTHTHAYKPPPLDWPRMRREAIIEKIADASIREGEKPGEYAAYDAQTGWYLLSEVVERVSGISNQEFVQKEIVQPLGCSTASIGMSAEKWTMGRDAGEIAVLHDTNASAREKMDLHPGAADGIAFPGPWVGDDAQRAAAHNPGGGAMGTAADLAKVYEMLSLRGKTPAGTVTLRDTTVEEMTRRQRVGIKDHSFGQVIDWGLGFLVNSARYGSPSVPYGYGKFASEETFGHGGMQSSSAYADPEHELAVVIIFNGLPGEPKHQKRVHEVNSALYRDLGLG